MKTKRLAYSSFLAICVILLLGSCQQEKDTCTRGIGIYPGEPAEDFSPVLRGDNDQYRNLAKLRPAYHSSSYDYNLTAQLVTDGIITDEHPVYISLSTNKEIVPKNEREWLFDHNRVTTFGLDGNDVWLQLDLSKSTDVPDITRISLNGNVTYDDKKPGGWRVVCEGSDDSTDWHILGQYSGSGMPGRERPDPFRMFSQNRRRNSASRRPNAFSSFFSGPYGNDSTAPRPSFTFRFGARRPQRILDLSFELKKPVNYHYYRVTMSAPSAGTWTLGDFDFYSNNTNLIMVPSKYFRSAWMSAGIGTEWVYVDLGTKCSFDNITLHWINKAEKGSVQVSDDAATWKDIASLPGNTDLTDEIKLSGQATGRYVRVLMTKPENGKRYVLSELEVFGRGGLTLHPKPNPGVKDNKLYLAGGNWKIQRASEVDGTGEEISKPGYFSDDWVIATVPGTALVSYWNAGALPNPNFGDNQLMISESFFNSDFWYRDEFEIPSSFNGDHIFLNFDGINWKADVFVNGVKAGRIEGAFIRGKFDVTGLIKPGQNNAIAVRIEKNAHIGVIKEQTAQSPDKNGGILGADNPTFHASIGWDWIPTIRGRNIGIWNDVFLSTKGQVTIENPFVSTRLPLPDTSSADVSIEVTLKNHSAKAVTGKLDGSYGDITFEKDVTLAPSESKIVRLDPSSVSSFHINNPKLWWPKGYGQPNLYDVRLSFKTDSGISDMLEFKSGIREMSYDNSDDILKIYINGRRFIGRGGNWGFSESNLEYRGREYDAAVAYHADMNFTMIRNWVGQTGDDEFFEACDRHGIMVWQDFWLANPADGPNPDDPAMFMKNAYDFVKKIRNHPSIAIYVGRNEGNPPEVIDTALQAMVKKIHPGLYYIPNSASGTVSGGGPYNALPVRDYFLLYGYNKLHSERGMPNVMTYESLARTLPDSALWPQNSMWGMHDYCLEGAQRAASFNEMIEKGFGKAKDARQFTEFAQWINYNGYRGMFEGRSLYRKGLLLWMSHPAWPSMVWQTYDYYLAPTAAYFGCKKASEPIHIQWNPVFDSVEVVNYSAGNRLNLTARARVINMDGSVQWEKDTTFDCREDFTVACFKLKFPETVSPVHFIKLTLSQDGKTISDNFYWRGKEDGNYQALSDMPAVKLETGTTVSRSGENWILTTTLNNTAKTPALMVRLKVIGKQSGSRLLPVFYSDNYISLMPGEKKVIVMRLKDEDTHGERPDVDISGFNMQ